MTKLMPVKFAGGRVLARTKGMRPQRAELIRMLTYMRPAGSKSEGEFIRTFIAPLAEQDRFGNLWRTIGDGSNGILWCSHTDTVHAEAGRQEVMCREGVARAPYSNCLGADDTTGVWLMVNMIRAGVPGTYCFHRGEECGGIGSGAVAASTPERLASIRFAIAFDRKGYADIITHQFTGRTASDEFAESVAAVLKPLAYQACDGGTFTDTASYEAIVPECTNIAVGYHAQHTKEEWQDVGFAERLLKQIISADWSGLVCARDPKVVELERWSDRDADKASTELREYVRRYPADVAEYLEIMGVTLEDIEDALYGHYEAAEATAEPTLTRAQMAGVGEGDLDGA